MPALSTELKKEILQLSVKEKDKLLLRLVAKNPLLINQLEFQLIEESLTVESRRAEIQENIDKIYRQPLNYPSYLLDELKNKSAQITMHLKVTKDKYGEVELLLNLLHDPFELKPHFFYDLSNKNDKLCQYLPKRTVYFLKKLNALNDELKLDFAQKTHELLLKLHKTCARYYAQEYDLPTEYIY
jgi:hypothetical protein